MLRQRTHPAATQRTARLEAFTDGVFAIAGTLLVLDLTSHSLGKVGSNEQLWAALGRTWPLFLNFAISFLLLCLLWMIHVQQFEHIARVDATLVWLNSFRLLFVVLVPFATNLTTEYADYLPARISLPLLFLLTTLISSLQWGWAVRNRETMLPDLTLEAAKANGRAGLSAVIIGVAVLILSAFVGTAAFLLYLLDNPLTRLLRGKNS